MDHDLVARHLDNWARWHRKPSKKLGYPTKAMVALGGGQSVSGVFDEMCEDADNHAAEIIDTIVNDLKLDQKSAVYHKWLGCVIRVRDQAKSLADAYDAIDVQINMRGLA